MNPPEVTETPALVSIPQAQHRLGGLSRKSVYRLISRGELTRVKVGGRAMITPQSIAALVQRADRAGDEK